MASSLSAGAGAGASCLRSRELRGSSCLSLTSMRPQPGLQMSRRRPRCLRIVRAAREDGKEQTGNWDTNLAKLKRTATATLVAMQIIAPIPLDATSPPASTPQHQVNKTAEETRQATPSFSAQAVLLSPDTKVPKNAEVALRRAVPVVNSDLRKIQDGLDEIFVLLRIPQRKPYGTMESNVKKALALAEQSSDALVAAAPAERQTEARELLEKIVKGEKDGLPGLLTAVQNKDADRVSLRLAATLDSVTKLAVLQAPGLQFLVPAQYSSYPKLTGRAVVEFTVLRGDGSTFSIKNGAESTKTGHLLAVLDGYSAPITAGNFAKLVSDRQYDGVAVKATEQAVISEARDAEKAAQMVPGDLPLELMPSGEFQPVYKTPLDVQDGELPVLPMSVFGAVVMSHSPQSENLNSPSQFFFYRYDKRNAGLGGLAFDEGQFSVFGYITDGKEVLSQLRTGDVIQSAKLISGADRLVLPPSTSVASTGDDSLESS